MKVLTINQLKSRATVSVPEAGAVLGISRNGSYQAAKRGEIPVIKIGGRLVVPTARLLRLLGAEEGATDAVA